MRVPNASDTPAIPPESPPPTLVGPIDKVTALGLYLDEGPYSIHRCHPMPHSADVQPPNDRRDTPSDGSSGSDQTGPTAQSKIDFKLNDDNNSDCPPPLMQGGNDSRSDEPSDDEDEDTDGPPPLLHNFQTDDDSSSDDSISDESSVSTDYKETGPPPPCVVALFP